MAFSPSHTVDAGNEITHLSATQLANNLATRQLSSVEVLEAFLAQIERLNPQVNAIVSEQPWDGLMARARELDTHIIRHGPCGLLHGIPQAPKDLAAVEGIVTTQGSRLFQHQVPTRDNLMVSRMRQAGALFIGRTNTPEFGLGGHTYNTVFGRTRNAFQPHLSAGGSSGGAAVAVALNMLPCADGSDMMGSLRTPAAFNNIFGFRPAIGTIPGNPEGELFNHQFSTAGPMARSIPDLALLLKVQAGFDPRLPLSRKTSFNAPIERDFTGTRIGWLEDLPDALPIEEEVLGQAQASLEHFETLGAQVAPVRLNVDMEELYHAWVTLRAYNFYWNMRDTYSDRDKRKLMKPEARWEAETGARVTLERLHDANRIRSNFYRSAMVLFQQVDFLVSPTTQVMPFAVEQNWPAQINGQSMDYYHRWMQIVITATLSGLPALAAPAGFNDQGIPVGIQLLGQPQADWEVLQLGHAYDQASRYSTQYSPLLE